MDELYWQSLDFIHELLEQIPAGVFWKNKESVFLGCNRFFAQLAEIDDPKLIVGKTDFDLPWGQFQAHQYIEDDQEVIRTKTSKLNIEEKQTLSNGQEYYLLTNKIPLFSAAGDVEGILGIFHDISRRKVMEVTLEQEKLKAEHANQVKGEFLANMSHDIRTPLTGVIGMSQYLYDFSQDEHVKQYARWIFESGEQLLGLLNSILDVVSLDSAQDNNLSEECVNLGELLNQIIKLHIPVSINKGLSLNIELSPELPQYVLLDHGKLYRILLNLLSNAIKFTKAGTVSLQVNLVKQAHDHVCLEFRTIDTGIGIPLELQSEVFERFYKTTPSYKGGSQGYGLGLHIAKKYVELLGGDLKLTSVAGQGTEFYFQINVKFADKETICSPPVNHTTVKTSHAHESTMLDAGLNGVVRLMLVEDNIIAKKLVEIFCADLGIECNSYETVENSLASYQNRPCDIIITDIGLPDSSGYELAQMIRKFEKENCLKKVPIIGLTAHARAALKRKCFQSGMQDVLSKPITKELLQEIVAEYSQPFAMQLNKRNQFNPSLQLRHPLQISYCEYEKLPLLNTPALFNKMKNKVLVVEMLTMFLQLDLQPIFDQASLLFQQQAYDVLLEKVHKIRGGAVYCYAERLALVSESLENVLLDKNETAVRNLFPLWIYVLMITIKNLERDLNQ